jgi:hypothetical protein
LYYAPAFEIYTDNNPLTYVLTIAKLNAMGHRWVAELADFNISKIHYKLGPTNTAADTLSHLPLDVEQYMASCTMTTEKEQMSAVVGSQSGWEEVDQVWVNCLSAEMVSDLESQAKSMVAIETLSKSQVQGGSDVINWCKGKKPLQHQESCTHGQGLVAGRA